MTSEAVMQAVMSGQFEVALERYAARSSPTPSEQRWAGVALLWRGQMDAARALLEAAAQAGERGAHLHLSYLHRTRGELGFAQAELEAANPLESALDRCFEVQQRALLHFAQDRLAQAAQILEQGWGVTYESPFGAALRPGLALIHGLILYTLGEHRAALSWLEPALAGSDAQAMYVQGWRAAALAGLGRIEEAQSALAAAQRHAPSAPGARAMHLFQRGITLRELGQVSESLGALSESAQIAFESGEPETEAVARLALLGVLYGSGRPLENDALSARGQLARAERVCRSSALRALLRLRVAQGALVNLRDQGGCDAVRIGALQLAGDLGGIAGELETLERHRDVLSAFLLQAEALLLAGRGVEAQGVLKESARRTAALGEPALGADLSGLPGVRLALSAASRESGLRALQAQRSPRLEVRVLGEGGLFLDGRRVRVGYRDAAEYILYLLRHPGVSSSELALALRPDAPARQTKVYLSALGHALAKTKLLKLHSSPATGVSLEFAQVELEVDLDTLEAHLSAGEVESAFALYRPLLPGGGEWAQREAERLARRVVGAGLLELTAAMASGEAQASCAWAERVHALDPFDPVLSAYLLEAVSLSQGEAPARMRAHQLQSAFMHEGLPLPQEVKSFLN